jgi:hypothetical protein
MIYQPFRYLGGAFEIRTHPFCSRLIEFILREKADFVHVLESPDDTSYFDTDKIVINFPMMRCDHLHHQQIRIQIHYLHHFHLFQ